MSNVVPIKKPFKIGDMPVFNFHTERHTFWDGTEVALSISMCSKTNKTLTKTLYIKKLDGSVEQIKL